MIKSSSAVDVAPTRAQPGCLPSVYWWLWAGVLVNRVGTFVGPFLVLFLVSNENFSPSASGEIVALAGAAGVGSRPIGGLMSDRVGPAATILLGSIATTVATLLLVVVHRPSLLVAVIVLLCLVQNIASPARSALVARTVPRADVVRAYSYLTWAVNLGYSASGLAAAAILVVGFRWLFLADAATVLACGVIGFLAARRATPVNGTGPAGDAKQRDFPGWFLGVVPRNRSLLLLFGGSVAFWCVYFQSFAVLPLRLLDVHLTARDFGLIMVANGLTIAVLQPLLTRLLGDHDLYRVLAFGSMLVACGLAVSGLANSLVAFLLLTVVWSIGEGLNGLALNATVATVSYAGEDGRAQAFVNNAVAIGLVLAPLAGLPLYQYVSHTVLWLMCLLLGCVSALTYLSARQTPARDGVDALRTS